MYVDLDGKPTPQEGRKEEGEGFLEDLYLNIL
jgi:hypothetical protein